MQGVMIDDLIKGKNHPTNLPSIMPLCAKDDPVSVLLIEDTCSDAVLTRIALDETKLPYALRVFSNGNEAAHHIIAQFKTGVMPDIILLDLGLPTMNGFEILDMLAAGPASIRAVPIIILTGYEHFEYIGKDNNLWIPAYMNKPCNPEKLREIMRLVIRRRI